MLLSNSEIDSVRDAIAEVEKITDAELVTVITKRSDSYHYIPTLWAAFVALITPAILMLSPLWLDMWEVALVQFIVVVVLALLLRIPAVMYRIIPKKVMHWRASNMARRQFLENNLHHTRHGMGVMIFVSEAEHYVEIIADRGISERVNDDEWQHLIDRFTKNVKSGKTLEGFLGCIDACGEILANVAPSTYEGASEGTYDKNELPDHLVVIG